MFVLICVASFMVDHDLLASEGTMIELMSLGFATVATVLSFVAGIAGSVRLSKESQ
jgi:hypothetical protein